MNLSLHSPINRKHSVSKQKTPVQNTDKRRYSETWDRDKKHVVLNATSTLNVIGPTTGLMEMDYS